MRARGKVQEIEARWAAAYHAGDVQASLKAVQERLALAREAQKSMPGGRRVAVGETFYLYGYALAPERDRITTARQTRIKKAEGSTVIADEPLAVTFPNTSAGWYDASRWSMRENVAQFGAAS